MRKILFFAVLISGCSASYTPTEQSIAIKKATKKMLLSKVERIAGRKDGGLTYYFILNENKTFSAVVDMDDSKKYEFCAGTFKNNNDTLTLNYYNNYRSKYLTDKAVIDNVNKEIIFLDIDPTKNTRMKFLAQL